VTFVLFVISFNFCSWIIFSGNPQTIKRLSQDDPDHCTVIPSLHIGCLSKKTVCMLFRTKLILSEKGSEQAEHRGTNRNFTNASSDET